MLNFTKKKAVYIISVVVFLIALSVIIGWYLDITFLISIMPDMIAMNPVTATMFLLLSFWLIVHYVSQQNLFLKFLQVGIALIVLLVGSLRLMAYLSFTEMRVDRLFFAEKLDLLLVQNAMAWSTSVLFILTGVLLLISYCRKNYCRYINDGILITAFLLAYLGMIGYIYSLEPFFRVGTDIPMALNTSITFMMLFIGLFLALPPGRLREVFFSNLTGGKLARRAIPLVLLIPPVFGYTQLLLQRAKVFSVEYSVVLDTGIIVFVVLILLFYYAGILNKKDIIQKIAERATILSEEKFRSLVYALKEGVVYFDRGAKILFYNPSFAEMTGYTITELIGKNAMEIFPVEENKLLVRQKMGERLKGVAEDYESTILHRDGTRINVLITARVVNKDENGHPVTFMSTFIDITERKQREEDIEAFSASAAHDLNAPLARIEALNGFIIQSTEERLEKEEIELLEMIHKITSDMRQLLKDLLFFYKVGIEKVSKSVVDMNSIVADVIKNVPPSSKAVILIENLPNAIGDASAIKQVWANLIYNAVKYSSKNEKSRVDIGFIEEKGKTVYFVKDNGEGFNMADFPKLFMPFKRLHHDFEGNGLGLPIVKRILEKHGGRIWAESEVKKGTIFYFTISNTY